MSERAGYQRDIIVERQALLANFGGLPETTVQNTTWLSILKEDALRQRVHRGKLIAVKRGKKFYSHPRFYRGRPQQARNTEPAPTA